MKKKNRPAWWHFFLPLAVYLVGLSFFQPPEAPEDQEYEPNSLGAALAEETPPPSWFGMAIEDERKYASCYAWYYAGLMAATLASLVIVSPVFRALPLTISWWGWVVGAVGAAVWIGLCLLHLEAKFFNTIGLGAFLDLGERAGFNPWVGFEGDPGPLLGFLIVRFLGLVVLVPLIEELLLRGLILRIVVSPNWEEVPFGSGGRGVILASMIYGIASHPSELLAAAAWFALITLLMLKTRSYLDCVIAHAVTNLLLGIFVIQSGHWELW